MKEKLIRFVFALFGHQPVGTALESIEAAHDQVKDLVASHADRLRSEQASIQVALDYFADKLAAVLDMRDEVAAMQGPERNDP